MGYAGRCVDMGIPDMGLAGYAEMIASGGTIPYSPGDFSSNLGISAVYSEQLNAFEGQYHSNTDDWVLRFWDSGIRTVPLIIWGGHDEGDMSANAATSSFSMFGENMWMTVEEVAKLFNASTDEFTPETFTQVYEDTWIKGHQEEAATNNPNPESEQAIIDEVKTEADPTDDGTDPIDDGSGTRRQLVSVAGRFVSAALRVFGI